MKKSIFSLFVLLVFTFQTSTAWDYLTIYFHNGSQPAKFYLADIDSICYSKIDIDSITQSDWQVQEIWAIDSIYRYMLSDIDSISYTTVNIDNLAKDIAVVSSVVEPLYMQCNSISQLSEHISLIQNTEGVENAWIDGQALYVKVRNYEPMVFLYPPHNNSGTITDDIFSSIMSQTNARSMKVLSHDNNHQYIDVHRACIVNQPYYDEDRKEYKKVTDALYNMFTSMDIKCDIINKPTPEFFSNDIFSYDLILLITHGQYDDNKHWLLTGEELLIYDGNKELTLKDKEIEWARKLRDAINKLRNRNPIEEIRICWVKETRDGKQVGVIYSHISENYIKKSHNSFKNKAIIFNAACESMKGNSNLGLIFVAGKGAGYYLGYTDINTIGYLGGCYFFRNMLNGKCTDAALEVIPNDLKEEDFVYNGKKYHPILKEIGKNRALCISRPQTISAEYQTSGRNEVIQLEGSMKILLDTEDNNYGFQYSINSDMSQVKDIKAEGKYDSSTLYMNWEATLDKNDLQPNTTYYYRAYMNDGFSDCYGEIKQFTTGIPDNYEAYTVLTNDTITFYYDDKRIKRQGTICNRTSNGEKFLYLNYNKGWLYNIKTAKFDPSFANYYATNMSGSFAYCTNMTEIIDIKYLKTDSVTDMREMFSDCRSLKNIDLSHFNTSKVKDMSRMFYVCWSLNSLDLSSFNTSNVTDMSLMFYECRALVNLDLSSFNTTKVTNMHKMFECCNSLINLDLSSFNPINVTDMGYMFHECNSMTSLKFGNFNTANVTNMYEMFYNCKSLTSLDLSSINTINVTNMTFMFHGCNSLTNLNLSSFNTSNVTDMAAMFYGCSSLTSLDLSSFNTSKSSGYGSFFSGCSSLHKIYVSSNWKQSPGTYMFYDCIKLEGGKGTKIGKNYYGSDDKGNPLYYNCGYDSSAAHIDGGKDWPGLFTTK